MSLDFTSIPNVQLSDDQPSGPPRINWYNGVAQARTPGAMYATLEQLGTPPSDPWVHSTRFPDEDGFETNDLRIAILGYRQQAFKQLEDRRVYLPQWEQGAQIHTEVLCFAEGIEQPVVWSARGLTGKAITGKNGIIAQYRAGLLREAERQAKRKLPLWMFWLPISTLRDAQGRVAYVATGYANNKITPPALALPSGEPLMALMDQLYVGNSMVEYGAEVRAEYEQWFKHRRGVGEQGQNGGENDKTADPSRDEDDDGDLAF